MAYVAAKCPSCGASIQVPQETGRCYCSYCGNQILTEAAVSFARVQVEGTVQTRSADFDIQASILLSYNGPSTDVVVPEGVTRIDDKAFGADQFNPMPIKRLAIPQSLEHINMGAISYLQELEEIATTSEGPYYTVVDGALYVPSLSALAVYPPNKPGAEFRVQPSTKRAHILNPRNLRRLFLPDGIETLVIERAWLDEVNFPDSLKNIYLKHCHGKPFSRLAFSKDVKVLSVEYCETTHIYLPDGMEASVEFDSLDNVTIRYPSSYLAERYPLLAADGKGLEVHYPRYSCAGRDSHEKLGELEMDRRRQEWRKAGRCWWCGGEMKGIVNKKCSNCGRAE